MINNIQPNYVLRFKDSNKISVKNAKYYLSKILGIAVLGIVFYLILYKKEFLEGFFSGAIFSEITAIAMVIVLGISLLLVRGTKRVPIPAELRFYNDYLVLFIQRKQYDKKDIKQEYYEIRYRDVTEVLYFLNTPNEIIRIYGNVNYTYFNFNPDGSLPAQPTEVNSYQGGTITFSTTFNTIDFIAEIERHSPLQVKITNAIY